LLLQMIVKKSYARTLAVPVKMYLDYGIT